MKYDLTRLSNVFLITSTLVSLFILWIYVLYFDKYTSHDIKDINDDFMGEKVKICGFVENLHFFKGFTSFYLSDGLDNNIKVIFFKKLNIFSRDYICIKGTVKLYKGELEIIGEEVV